MSQRVAICVITCKRPLGLARLLDGLATLRLSHAVNAQLIVVDNDDGSEARAVCAARDLPFPLTFAVESRRGIPFARNTAVARAGDVDFIAFIDDDEVPEPNWLHELMRVQRAYDADVVTGPVVADLGTAPPNWAVRGRFFDSRRYTTGTAVDNAFTNNVLYRRVLLDSLTPPFNEGMGLTGGTDAFLSRRLKERGARMVWANDAVVTEAVPSSRISITWVLRRAFRVGVTRAYTDQAFARTPIERARVASAGPLRVGKSVARLPLALLRGRHHGISAMRAACYGAGMMAGSVGLRYDEYRTIHGH